jgi:hypothetical protein
MVRLPIIGDIFSPQKKQDTPEQENNIRLSGTIPTQQAGQLPTYEIVKEAAKTKQVSDEWKKKYCGYDIDNAGVYGNIPVGYNEIVGMSFLNQQNVLDNFTPVDCVFDDQYTGLRWEVIQMEDLVKQVYSKSINSNFANRCLGTYSNNKTEMQVGGIQRTTEPKGGIKSFLFR